MLDKIFRNLKEILLLPLAKLAGGMIHPDVITILSFAAGMVSVGCILQKSFTAALGFWILNRVLDGLDGSAARASGRVSDFGAYLDIVLDFIIYSAIPVSLVIVYNSPENYLMLSILLSSYYVNAVSWSYLSAILEKRNLGAASNSEMTSVTMPSGVADGTMTIIFYTLFLIFPGYIKWLFMIFTILVVVSIIQRMVWAFLKIR